MKLLQNHALRIAVVIVVIAMVMMMLSGCNPFDQSKTKSVWAPPVEDTPETSTRYRISRNKVLWDVTLKDGSRCVIVTGGGTYCEFVK